MILVQNQENLSQMLNCFNSSHYVLQVNYHLKEQDHTNYLFTLQESFIGSAVRLERVVQNDILAPISFVDSDLGQIDVVGATAFGFDEVTQFLPEVTGIARDSGDSDGIFKRVIIDDSLLTSIGSTSIVDIQKQYETLRAAELRTSPTFDADSTGLANSVNIDFSNAFTSETIRSR